MKLHRVAPARRAFTLPELLVVISIMGVLVALSAAAVFRVMGSQQRANTRTFLTRLDSQLRQHLAYVRDRSEGAPSKLADLIAGGDKDRGRVIEKKMWIRHYFPTSFAEVFNPANGIPPRDAYRKYLRDHGITAPNAAVQPYESAACLYMILRHGPDQTAQDEVGVAGSVRHVGALPVLVDGWGNPLAFSRWPTGDPATGVSGVNPSGYTTRLPDPFDPKGFLTSPAYLGNVALRKEFESRLHPLPPANRPRQALRLYPVIVSAGPDGLLGLEPGTLRVLDQAQAKDNIYSNIDAR